NQLSCTQMVDFVEIGQVDGLGLARGMDHVSDFAQGAAQAAQVREGAGAHAHARQKRLNETEIAAGPQQDRTLDSTIQKALENVTADEPVGASEEHLHAFSR